MIDDPDSMDESDMIPDPKVRGYEVHLSPAAGETDATGVTKTTGGSTLRLPVLLLEPDTAYNVRVRARTHFASGPWSDTAQARTNALQGSNNPSVMLDLDGVTKLKVGDKLYKRLKVTGMNNLHADAFPEWFEGYYQGNFVEFRVLGRIQDSYEYEDLTRGYGEGAFYAGALTIGEDGEVYHDFGYEVIAEGRAEGEKGAGAPGYGPLYLWLERTTGGVQIGSTTAYSRETALCVEIADDSNTVPTGRECSSMDGSPEESPGHAVQRITARFNDVPPSHDGESEFNFRLAFVKDVGISPTSLREDALAATGGAVTRVQRVDDRSDLFEITAEPDSDEDVTITLSSSGDCGESGAVCTQEEDPRKLYNSPTATVAGPILTASFQGLPSQHDGETAFSFRIAFSDEIATGEADVPGPQRGGVGRRGDAGSARGPAARPVGSRGRAGLGRLGDGLAQADVVLRCHGRGVHGGRAAPVGDPRNDGARPGDVAGADYRRGAGGENPDRGLVEPLRAVRRAGHLHDLPVAGQRRPRTGGQRPDLQARR